ncbi:hypothetical protein [Parasitella parasitica]|uniref:DNA replication complex GINS protein SLD5 n=1 Tax=Parasitella parasitica TaxID=35722 RepID=A0A0B7N6G0_9FUNG|nr:hypothetical protein [Parasitella parasitica]
MESQTQSEEPESFLYSSLPSFARDALDEQDDSSFTETQTPFDDSFFGGDGIIGRAMGDTIDSLTKIWMDERNAPEMLPYEHALVEPLILAIETQAENIMERMENQTESTFESMLYQTEIERIKYLLKSYLRCRLWKIEKYTLHLLRQPDLKEILSSQEIGYARRYQELIESHNYDSFLYQLPRSQHKQDESTIEIDMVVRPNLDAPVFCRVLSHTGHVEINNDSVLFEPNDIYILRYSDVRVHLKEKKSKVNLKNFET